MMAFFQSSPCDCCGLLRWLRIALHAEPEAVGIPDSGDPGVDWARGIVEKDMLRQCLFYSHPCFRLGLLSCSLINNMTWAA